MTSQELDRRFPGLAKNVAAIDGVGIAMLKGVDGGELVTRDGSFRLRAPLAAATRALLERFDDPDVLGTQLRRLNSFERSGDLVVFGAYDGRLQVNFEDQVGGHGSIGGDQLHPFVLAKNEWGFETSPVTNTSELYPMLVRLRDRV
jgi:hypothetical protein